jgi:uncharacterized radical SAM superfamily Fe-S cluster-containing enzyme
MQFILSEVKRHFWAKRGTKIRETNNVSSSARTRLFNDLKRVLNAFRMANRIKNFAEGTHNTPSAKKSAKTEKAKADAFFAEEAKGRLTPKAEAYLRSVMKSKAEAHLRRVMKALAGAAEYEFSENDKVVKSTPTADLQAFIKALPVVYQSGEQATAAQAAEGASFARADVSKMSPDEAKKAAMAKLRKQYSKGVA